MVALATVAISGGLLVAGTGAQAAPAAAPAYLPGSHAIINYNSNKCLQPQSLAPNALIEQRDCDNTSRQRWTSVDVGDGYALLVNQASGLCLDLQANSFPEVGNGTLTQQFYCSWPYDLERWNMSPGSRSNHFQVFNAFTVPGIGWMCLDVRNRSKTNGALIQIWSCNFRETAQEFRFVGP